MERMSLDFIGQCLHAQKLEFNHPITGKHMKLEAKLPEQFEKLLHTLCL